MQWQSPPESVAWSVASGSHLAFGGDSTWTSSLGSGHSKPGSSANHRIRRDRVDGDGKVTLRFLSQLRHIYVGRVHRGRAVVLSIVGPEVRAWADDGTLVRELIIDPARKYQSLAAMDWHLINRGNHHLNPSPRQDNGGAS